MTEAEFAARKAEATARMAGERPTLTPPENLPTGDVLSDAQREAAQRAYQGLSEPGAGDSSVNWEALQKPPKVSPDTGAEAIPSPLESNPEYADLAKIKRGEGMWHAVRRQLNYQRSHTSPEEFAKRYGVSAEDIKLHPKKSVERITGN